jgi:hypothetical protein
VSRWQELQMPGADAGRPFDQQLVASLDNFAQGLRAILDRGIALGDNVDCEIVAFTSSATPDAELAVPHSLGKVPLLFHRRRHQQGRRGLPWRDGVHQRDGLLEVLGGQRRRGRHLDLAREEPMGTWNPATPAGTDPMNQVDDRMRERRPRSRRRCRRTLRLSRPEPV